VYYIGVVGKPWPECTSRLTQVPDPRILQRQIFASIAQPKEFVRELLEIQHVGVPVLYG
jgi:hypothetical protein